MANNYTDDYAILVGISKYWDNDYFPELKGPPNDLDLMTGWLTSPDGGNVNPEHITRISSPDNIKIGANTDNFPPGYAEFFSAYKKLVTDEKGTFKHFPSRLYLYFSGHGFCERISENPQATLYAAMATPNMAENIAGTDYANKTKENAIFNEIVLIMDCCRDAEFTRPIQKAPINISGNSNSSNVKLFCIYAAPKGGKAQERRIDDKYYSLFTHAFFKAFSEVKPHSSPFDKITSTELKNHLLESWSIICGDSPVPEPEFVLPNNGEIKFHAKKSPIRQNFKLLSFLESFTVIEIRDSELNTIVSCELYPNSDVIKVKWRDNRGSETLDFKNKMFTLELLPDYYQYELSGGLNNSGLFAVVSGGVQHVQL